MQNRQNPPKAFAEIISVSDKGAIGFARPGLL